MTALGIKASQSSAQRASSRIPRRQRILVVGATTFVGKHCLSHLSESGALANVSVRNDDQEREIRSALPALETASQESGDLVFARHFIESETSWRSALEQAHTVVIFLGPEIAPYLLKTRSGPAEQEMLTAAFKAMSSSGIRRCIIVLHSHESLIEDSDLEPKDIMSQKLPAPTFFRSRRSAQEEK